MLMQCVEAGGLPVVRAVERERRLRALYDDESYRMNEFGFYEPPAKALRHPSFPRMHGNHAVKIVIPNVRRIAAGNYLVAIMRRDAEEISHSLTAALDVHISAAAIEREVQESIEVLRQRRDVVSLVELWYRDVLARPAQAVARLTDAGWPIDRVRAVTAIRHDRIRAKRELLTCR